MRSALGRFSSPDSIVPSPFNPADWDRFAYVRGNPVKYTDPSGHSVACGTDSGNGCQGTGLGDATPSQILNSQAPDSVKDRAIYNYSQTHPDYNYALDPFLEDTGKYLVSNAIFIGSADAVYRLPKLIDRINSSWTAYANGLGLTIAGIIVGGGNDSNGPEIPSTGRPTTGRTTPLNLKEKLALQAVMADPGKGIVLSVTMTDPRWPASDEWVKMAQNVNGKEIHYVRNTITGQVVDFKFK